MSETETANGVETGSKEVELNEGGKTPSVDGEKSTSDNGPISCENKSLEDGTASPNKDGGGDDSSPEKTTSREGEDNASEKQKSTPDESSSSPKSSEIGLPKSSLTTAEDKSIDQSKSSTSNGGDKPSDDKLNTSNPSDSDVSESTPVKENPAASSKQPESGEEKSKAKSNKAKSNSVDFVVISDDEGEANQNFNSMGLNGNYSPNCIDSEDSDDLDELDVIGDDEDSGDNADDEIEITGVSIANNEFGTVGGMDQLLRTLINQGWTETEIMSQLRGMIAPYQSRQRLMNFNSINDVVDCIKRVNKIIIVSGAGISVSCGIPDFRSETGLYARLSKEYPTLPNPTAMFDLNYFLNDPKPFFTFAKEIWPGQFKPSPCHKFIKLLESHGKLLRNYTQNIDTLEQVAGIDNVIQCHGSFATASCIYCRYRVPGSEIKDDIMEGRAPQCPKCNEMKLIEGKKIYNDYAKSRYREIKKKLHRREKFSSSSSSESEASAPASSKTGKEATPQDNVTPAARNESDESREQPSSSKQCSSSEPMEVGESRQADDSQSKSDKTEKEKISPVETSGKSTVKESRPQSSDNTHAQSSSSKDQPMDVTPDKSDAETASPEKESDSPLDPILKPDIVFFGEDLPRNFFDHAEEDLEQAELIIVMGSSMKVKPVASIPEFVQERTPRVLINREPVRHISFDVQLLGDADEIVQQLCHKLEWESPVDEGDSEKKRSHRHTVIPLEELSPLPTRQVIEEANSAKDAEKAESSKSPDKTKADGKEAKDDEAEKQEFEEPCPLFGARCQCPLSWNIARYLPDDSVAKMQPNTFIFPGANVMHPKHVFTASKDLYTVDSDSDLGGFENPIEVSSSEASGAENDNTMELSDTEDEVDSTTKTSPEKSQKENAEPEKSQKENAEPEKSQKENTETVEEASSSKQSKVASSEEKSADDNVLSSSGDGVDSALKRPLDETSKSAVPSKFARLDKGTDESSISNKESAVAQSSEEEAAETS